MIALGTIGMLAPARVSSGIHVSTTVVVVVALIAVIAAIAILGWRAPDRSPGADTETERERIDH
jgi:hypothetical protein